MIVDVAHKLFSGLEISSDYDFMWNTLEILFCPLQGFFNFAIQLYCGSEYHMSQISLGFHSNHQC
jgi:hypothetical protein